ncbi:hypothetical protein ISN44_As09g027140 [Arabidopsis suecica]|uniref:Uncharacterized protein n=1 Tax=Arabidopsis suecica TaxID=45249 RepID=A0A8T2AJU3_ARASU|nr:hypothetical protein ISN44_As09g027140 [Arabidopsis suecica]
MDDETENGKIVMNKEQLLLFMENRRKQEEHRLALEKATRSEMVDLELEGIVSKASLIMNNVPRPAFNEDHILAVKNIISEIVKASRDRASATKKLVEQDSSAGDGTTPLSI